MKYKKYTILLATLGLLDLNGAAIAQQLNPGRIQDCYRANDEASEICSSYPDRCDAVQQFLAMCNQIWSGLRGNPDPNPNVYTVPTPNYQAPNPTAEYWQQEQNRMRCEENCSTFGNAYQEGGLDRIHECQARCRQ